MAYFCGLRPSAVEYQMLDALYLYDALNLMHCILNKEVAQSYI